MISRPDGCFRTGSRSSWAPSPPDWLFSLSGGRILARFEAKEGLTRGAPGSERAAMIFGQYFPNPAIFGTGLDAQALTSPLEAMLVEAFGTAILVLVIFALTDPKNRVTPEGMVPFFIGFTVALLICLFAPITQAGWNPARDLGPRLVAWAVGFGSIAIPGPRGGFWIYLVGPCLGAVAGAALYQYGIRSLLPHTADEAMEEPMSSMQSAQHRRGSESRTEVSHDEYQTACALSLHPQFGALPDGRGAPARTRRGAV